MNLGRWWWWGVHKLDVLEEDAGWINSQMTNCNILTWARNNQQSTKLDSVQQISNYPNLQFTLISP
jgi:hypothetical protein